MHSTLKVVLAAGLAIATCLTSACSGTDADDATASNSEFWVEEVVTHLHYPWSMAWLPDGDILITERGGTLRRVHDGKLEAEPLAGLPKVFGNHVEGLLDIKLDPDFASSQFIYLSLTEGDDEARNAAVYRGRYTPEGLVDVERIFRSKDSIRGVGPIASRLMFLPDKTLLFAVTEAEAYRQFAQRMDSHIGKVIRINRDGSIPKDNPFLGTPGALPEIYTVGHRVQSGLYYDDATKTVWETDIGPNGGDELNILKAGQNYGWPEVTWGFEYSGQPISNRQAGGDFVDPVRVWSPAVSPSGVLLYKGTTYPTWNGDLFIGNLTTKQLRRLRVKDGKVELDETLLADLGERIRSPFVGPDNHIYLLTDHDNGRLLRLQPGKPMANQVARIAKRIPPPPALNIWVDEGGMNTPEFDEGDAARGKTLFAQSCAACHSVGKRLAGGAIGPDLSNVLGRPVGKQSGYNYSSSMSAATQTWDRITLNLFMSNPEEYFPGTNMRVPPVTDPKDRRDIVGYLKSPK